MDNITEVKCDQCEEMFEMKILTRNRGRDIKEAYFDCPHCNHTYISYRTNGKARSLQKKVQELIKQAKWTKDPLVFGEIQEEITEKREQLQKIMKGLMDQ
ncbi:hypothetical protein ACTHP3_21215 [Shouchella rhizosphaerae]|uniref:hypothetical protein n=1 Tax=Shouchella rhizosphaerae TaxID=866786 RepID=UPI003F809FF4